MDARVLFVGSSCSDELRGGTCDAESEGASEAVMLQV